MATNDSNTTHGERDTDFGCPHYEAVPGKKRCRHYLDGGSCARPDEFMCVEWLRLNKKAKPAPKTKGPTDLFGNPVPEPKQPKRTTPTQQRPTAAMASPASAASEVTEEPEPLRGLTTEDIESFKRLGVEVCVESESFGEVWLVPEYTGGDRQELAPEHAATICHVLHAFPGSKVSAFHKIAEQKKEEHK